MLGERYAELKGKITSQRVLDIEGPFNHPLSLQILYATDMNIIAKYDLHVCGSKEF
jgi:hypothetical protein